MKKRLCALLTLMLFSISSFGIYTPAYSAEEIVIPSDSYLSQLGINEGINTDESAEITRAEFVALVIRALNFTDVPTANTAFSDCTSEKFASEIQYAYDLAITSGTAESTFSPGLPVSKETAAKMIVSALGYTMKAEAMGGFPTGYMAVANSLDIFDGTSVHGSVKVGEAQILVTNMLLADMAEFAGVNGTDIITESYEGSNLLMKRFGFDTIRGVVTTAGHFAVNPEFVQKGDIEIDGNCFRTDLDVDHLLGYSAQIWYDSKDSKAHVIVPDSHNKAVTLDMYDIEGFSDNTIFAYDQAGKLKKYTLGSDYTFILNGRAVVAEEEMLKGAHGSAKLIDNDDDGSYEFVICNSCEYFVISAIDMISGTIYDSNSTFKRICFTDDEFNYKITINGVKSEFDQLSKDMVCRVYMSEDSKVCRIYATDEKVSGNVSEVGDDGFVIDDKMYKTTPYFERLGEEIKAGSDYEILISDNGLAVGIADSKNSGFNYGYFMDYAQDSGINDEIKIKLLTSMGEIEVYSLASKVFLDGVKLGKNSSQIREKLVYSESGRNYIPRYQVIRYKASEDEITHIDTFVSAATPWVVGSKTNDEDSLTRYVDKVLVNYRQNTDFGVPNVPMRGAIIFQVPKALETETGVEYSDDMFSVVGTGVMVNNEKYPVDAYDYDEEYVPQVVVLYNSTSADLSLSPNNNAKSGIVMSINPVIDSDGVPCRVLRIYGDGIYTKYYMKEEIYSDLKSLDKIPDSGDVVRLSFDVKGYVNGISLDADYNHGDGSVTINYGVDSLETSATAWLTYFAGKVVANSTSYITIDADNSPTDAYLTGDTVTLPVSSPRYVIYNAKSGEAYLGKAGNIVSSASSGEESASYVVCKSTYYQINTVYIYIN